ncbi:MAG: hypothetical protein ACYC0X_26310 [Pirellulaceae bacterium]
MRVPLPAARMIANRVLIESVARKDEAVLRNSERGTGGQVAVAAQGRHAIRTGCLDTPRAIRCAGELVLFHRQTTPLAADDATRCSTILP